MKKPCFWLNLTCFAHGWMSQQLKESNKNSKCLFQSQEATISMSDFLGGFANCQKQLHGFIKNANGWGNVGPLFVSSTCERVDSFECTRLSLGGIEHPAWTRHEGFTVAC